MLVGIIALALNLRPAAVSIGPVLTEIRDSLDMSAGTAGLLTSLPVIAFAIFGALTPRVAHHLGLHRTTLLGLVLLATGLSGRAFVDSAALFLLLSTVALAGMATANVLLPTLVKLHFPDRIGRMTSIYTTALAVGLTTSLMLTVPLSEAFGSWRWGLLAWGLVAALAILPWSSLIAHDLTPSDDVATYTMKQVARTPLGWAMVMCFGLQSAHAYVFFGWFPEIYRDAGFSATEAGVFVGVATAVTIPISLWMPAAVARAPSPTPYFLVLMACYTVGYIGVLTAITTLPWLWSLLLGIGGSVFPLVLTLIGLRARTTTGTRALSGFTQSVGYLVAAPGPWLFGVVHQISGNWTVPVLISLVMVVPLTISCLYVARPAWLEDQITSRG